MHQHAYLAPNPVDEARKGDGDDATGGFDESDQGGNGSVTPGEKGCNR